MRVTFVNQYYPPDTGPTGRLAASLARHRADLGDEVTVVSSTGRYAGGPPPGGPTGHDDRVNVLRTWALRRPATSITRRAFQYLAFRRLVRLALLHPLGNAHIERLKLGDGDDHIPHLGDHRFPRWLATPPHTQ